MFRFANPEFLYLLLIIPLLLLIFLQAIYARKKKIQHLGEWPLLKGLMLDVSSGKRVLKFILKLLALTCLILIVARPQMGMKVEQVRQKGIEMVVALDVSNSMWATDVSPNRIGKAKMLVSNIADKLTDNKIALIVFAGQAFIQLPITSDFVSAKMFLDAISPSMIPTQGTNLGEAIRLSMASFTVQKNVERAIVIITDGEDQAEEAEAMAAEAFKKGIHVFVLGIGSTKGSTIPVKDGSVLHDKQGNIVITRLNEEMAQRLASAGHGAYIHVDNTHIAQDRLSYELNKLGKAELGATSYAEYAEQFPMFSMMALIFILLDALLTEKKKPFSQLFNFFRK